MSKGKCELALYCSQQRVVRNRCPFCATVPAIRVCDARRGKRAFLNGVLLTRRGLQTSELEFPHKAVRPFCEEGVAFCFRLQPA
eukprot:10518303-Alexandrium_andersonii.AAC.1